MFANDVKQSIATNDPEACDSLPAAHSVKLNVAAQVIDGSLKFGFGAEEGTPASFICFDNATLYFFGDMEPDAALAEAYKMDLKRACSASDTLKMYPMASAEPVEASVEENQVVNPAPEAEIPEPVEAPEPTETSEPTEPSEVSESTETLEPSEPVVEAEEEAEPAALLTSGADVIAKLKSLPNFGVSIARDELEHLKQAFYRWHNAAISEVKDAFVAAGNDADAFVPADRCPELVAEEEEFKEVMTVIREKRAEAQKELDRIREQNLLRKEAILERLKTMIDNADTVPVSYDDFQTIQQEWREIKDVPPEKASELWKTYQSYTERFYDIRKLNNMFRDYDFKKNLEVKTQLCEQAEKLAEEPDVVVAFRQLQKLHQEFREAGPVAKELREDIWNRFKEASTVINRRHQQYFEEIKKTEKENLEQKIAICEIMESIDYDALNGYAKWNDKTQEVLALQGKWKSLGFAPKKQNQKVFERFRAACDVFFTKKAEFFKSTKESLSTNLEKKIALCEQAEALKDSTDWKATADKLAALQKEWRSIGAVPKKQSEAVWKRFMTACDAFFSNRNNATSSQRSEEHKNLTAKKDIGNSTARMPAIFTICWTTRPQLKRSSRWTRRNVASCLTTCPRRPSPASSSMRWTPMMLLRLSVTSTRRNRRKCSLILRISSRPAIL